jgi:hypothetical protein
MEVLAGLLLEPPSLSCMWSFVCGCAWGLCLCPNILSQGQQSWDDGPPLSHHFNYITSLKTQYLWGDGFQDPSGYKHLQLLKFLL